jgi:DNA polymerase (family 10)
MANPTHRRRKPTHKISFLECLGGPALSPGHPTTIRPLLQHAAESLQATYPKLKRITIAGDFRRGCELVGDLSIVAEAPSSGPVRGTPAQGALHVHLSDRKHFGATLLFATGSAAHLDSLQALAANKGMRLDPSGLSKGPTAIAADEKEIYRNLGLPFIEPELREGRGEIERARLWYEPHLERIHEEAEVRRGI